MERTSSGPVFSTRNLNAAFWYYICQDLRMYCSWYVVCFIHGSNWSCKWFQHQKRARVQAMISGSMQKNKPGLLWILNIVLFFGRLISTSKTASLPLGSLWVPCVVEDVALSMRERPEKQLLAANVSCRSWQNVLSSIWVATWCILLGFSVIVSGF